MIRLKHGVQVLLSGTLAYVAACGGSSSPDTGAAGSGGSADSFAGTTATGGQSTASAGTFGESGSTSTTSGGTSGDNIAGTNGVAGEGVGGGAIGGSGAGGKAGGSGGMSGASTGGAAAGGANSCPTAAPTDGSMCTTTTAAGDNCLYIGESCACRAAVVIPVRPGPGAGGAGGAGGAAAGGTAAGGAGGAAAAMRTWRCTGSGAACPATAPADGAMCMNPTGAGGAGGAGPAAALDCPYPDGSTCRCNARGWACTAPPPPACPAMEPTGACTAVQACTYGTAAMRVRCECDGKAWGCDKAGDPAVRCTAKARAALATGDTCTGIGECPAAGAVGAAAATCVCDGMTVTCN